ncbi:hypothetical protein M408DRAFT_27426 [Serendipita vermifera MAFF 305830]|uniref:Uncharacterized protein n=1 Tax=Serendipita vermifera MAFF 305830 TaxID=933852 RepID=A0A0C3AVD6_SERVB|nr:hypothetical protein M408DRAFT_27426 [Serendipita vermifera MAFF 305830]
MSETPPSFVAPEGAYNFLEEHKPQHLTVSGMNASSYPTRISSITIKFQAKANSTGPGLTALLGGVKDSRAKDKEKEREKEREKEAVAAAVTKDGGESYSSSENGAEERDITGDFPAEGAANPSVSPESNLNRNGSQYPPPATLFSSPTSSNTGRKRSHSTRKMQNIRTTSSSFVTRMQTMEGLTKQLAQQVGDATFLFYNASKSFIWTQEPLARVTFSAFPTCHDINTVTACSDRIDIVIGFSTGDLVWFDPITSRYVRINKQVMTNVPGSSTASQNPCTAVKWVPSSRNLFLASYADGTMVVYDGDREDGPFTPKEPHGSDPVPLPPPSPDLRSNGSSVGANGQTVSHTTQWDPLYDMFVTPNHTNANEKSLKNPVSHWRVSKKKILDFAFSPDVRYVAVVAEDGCLRVIDALSEKLLDTYSSYFGYLTTVTWSPDGRFLLTGGQDDLITIVSPLEQRVIARCQGHASFVSSVSFDHTQCDGRTYRFGSVGEDNRLLLWDFSSGTLHRPKANASAFHNRASLGSTLSLALRRRTEPSTLYLPADALQATTATTYHPAPSRNDVSVLQPIQATSIDGDLLTRIEFTPTAVVASTRSGLLRVWSRPSSQRPGHAQDTTVTA